VVASPIDAIQQGDVSLVVVATPNDTHAPLAEAALRAGKHVVLDYPTRQVILSSSMPAADHPPRFLVRGTTGSLVKHGCDPQERRLIAGERPGRAEWGDDPDPLLVLRDGAESERVPVPSGDYGRFYVAISDAIREGTRVPVSAAEAVTTMAIIAAGIDSSAAGRAVPAAGVLTP